MQFKLPDVATVLAVHDIVLEEYGGLPGVPHIEYIESALNRPQNYMAYDNNCDLHLIAVLILDGIARNHAFADGNKRTALITMLMVYNFNIGMHKPMRYGLHMNNEFEAFVLCVTEQKPPITKSRERLAELVERFWA